MSAHLSYTTKKDDPLSGLIIKLLVCQLAGGESEGNGKAGARRAKGAQ